MDVFLLLRSPFCFLKTWTLLDALTLCFSHWVKFIVSERVCLGHVFELSLCFGKRTASYKVLFYYLEHSKHFAHLLCLSGRDEAGHGNLTGFQNSDFFPSFPSKK